MSTAETGARQHDRLCARGSIPTLLPELRDVDTYADAHLVASDIPRSRFAGELDRIVDEIDGPAESEDAA
jgi:hypothetical protein